MSWGKATIMLNNIRIELYKIRKSKLGLMSFILILFLAVFLFAIFTYTDRNISIFKFFFKVFAGLNYFPFLIPAAVFINMTFANEIENRTMVYSLIRPISNSRLFLGKIIASFILTAWQIFILSIVTFLYGAMVFNIVPFEFDKTFLVSITRCLVYFLFTYLALLLYIGFCSLVSLSVRNMVSGCIISIIIGVFSNLATIRISNFRFPLSTLVSPASYYDLGFHSYLLRFGKVSTINIFILLVLIGLAFNKYKKLRKEGGII